mgnify:CR=1 FL=1
MAKSKNNVNDALVVKEVSQEEVDNFNIDTHLLALMWAEPFFSSILRHVAKIKTDKIPTAGVSAQNGEIKMWWNPKFLAGLTADEVRGLFKHECYHLIFEHTTTRKHDPHIIWNYATDLAINSLIDENELPDGGLIPGKPFSPLTAEQVAQMGPAESLNQGGMQSTEDKSKGKHNTKFPHIAVFLIVLVPWVLTSWSSLMARRRQWPPRPRWTARAQPGVRPQEKPQDVGACRVDCAKQPCVVHGQHVRIFVVGFLRWSGFERDVR